MTSDKILSAARELFEEKGFDSTSVREIATMAGVNVALINYHFGSKDLLLAALINQVSSSTFQKLSDINKSVAKPEEKLNQAIEHMTDKIFDNKKYYQMLHREMSISLRPELNKDIVKVLLQNRKEIQKIIEEGQQSKVFRKDIDLDLTISTLFGFIYQTTQSMVRAKLKGAEDDEVLKERVKKHMWELLSRFLKKN